MARGGVGVAFGGLGSDGVDRAHHAGDARGHRRDLGRGRGDVADQLGEARGHRLDPFSDTPAVSARLAPLTTSVVLFHRDDGFVGVGLNGLDQRFDALRGVAGAFGEALDLVGDHREAAPNLTGGAGLDRRRSARGMLVWSAMSLISLTMSPILREDSSRRLMRWRSPGCAFADRVRTWIVRRTRSPPSRAQAAAARPGGAGRLRGHLVHRARHLRDVLPEVSIWLACSCEGGQALGDRAGFLGGGGDAAGGVVDGRDEIARALDRVVDRVGDRAGDVLGDAPRSGRPRRGRPSVEQPQDGLLVVAVLVFGLCCLPAPGSSGARAPRRPACAAAASAASATAPRRKVRSQPTGMPAMCTLSARGS